MSKRKRLFGRRHSRQRTRYEGDTLAAGPSKTFHSFRIIRVIDTTLHGIMNFRPWTPGHGVGSSEEYASEVRVGDEFAVEDVKTVFPSKTGIIELVVKPHNEKATERFNRDKVYQLRAKEYAIDDVGPAPALTEEIR